MIVYVWQTANSHLLKECLDMYPLPLIPPNSFRYISSAPHKSNANNFLKPAHLLPLLQASVQIFNIYLIFLIMKAPSIIWEKYILDLLTI